MVLTVVMSPWAKRTHRPEIPCSLAAAQVDRGPLGCTLCMVIWVYNWSIFGFVNAYLGHYVLYSTIWGGYLYVNMVIDGYYIGINEVE